MENSTARLQLFGKASIFGLGLFGLVFVLLWLSPQGAEWLVRETGYYFVGLATLWFVFSAFKAVRCPMPSRFDSCALILGVLAAGSLLFVHEELGPKVAMDDYVLSATAKSLSMERDVEVLTLGRNFNGYFIRADQYVDKRPWLYSFAVSVVHDLTGYRFQNAFVVNLFFGVLLLILTALFGYRIGGLPAGLIGPFLWASLPLLGQNATGGGLDMLNLLLLFGLFLSSLYYLREPNADRLTLLVLTLVLLCYTRYESFIFWGPAALVILAGWARAGRPIVPMALATAPVLMLALAALQNYLGSRPDLWELSAETVSRFGADYLLPNFYSALFYLLNFGDELSNSFLLALVGLPCVALLLYGAAKSVLSRDSRSHEQLVYLVFGAGILAHFLLILSYHDGQLDERISSRFALPLYLLFVIATIVVMAGRVKQARTWWLCAVVIAIFTLGVALPNKAKGIYSKRNFVVQEAEWLAEQASISFEPMSLVVDADTIIWTLNEWHSIRVDEAVSNLSRLEQERARGKFPQIYLIERLSAVYDEEQQIRFRSDFMEFPGELELVAERSFEPLRMTRVSRVVELDYADALPRSD